MKDPLLGRTIAQRYRLISCLGAGPVASVYLARHVLIGRLNAIKIVHPELTQDPTYQHRFLREARAVNRINHPNIVEITDYGEAEGLVYLVMEYVPGESLAKVLERGPLGWRRAASIGMQLASALGRAHQMGVVHRDLRPGNVLVVPRRDGGDLAKLTDFGGARVDATISRTGEAIAFEALPYAAPEHRELGIVDEHTDLYALGAVLYEAALGTPPYARGTVPGAAPPERLATRAEGVPTFFDEVVMTLLAPRSADRPRDGFEAVDLLHRALEQEHPDSGRGELSPDGASSPRPSVSPKPSAPPLSPAAGIRIASAPFDRIGRLCAEAHGRLEAEIAARGPLPAHAQPALDEARRLSAMVSAVGDLVASDSQAIEAVEARGRDTRAELGRRLDEAAREHSRALGWAGTIAERTYVVEARRTSGEHSLPAVEAMIWEQAALEQEEDRVRESAALLVEQMRACQAEIERHNERIEHELLVVNGCLEGRIAALRALAVEAWAALGAAAERAGIPPETWSAAG